MGVPVSIVSESDSTFGHLRVLSSFSTCGAVRDTAVLQTRDRITNHRGISAACLLTWLSWN